MTKHTRQRGASGVATDLQRWAQWMRAAGRSPATIRTRICGMETLCRHAGINAPVELAAEHITDWLAGCDKPWTRSTYWTTVRAWSVWALDQGLITADPTARLSKPRSPKCSPRPVTDAVIHELLTHPPNPRVRVFVAFAALAGLRVHEIAKVAWEDLDLAAGLLFVDGKGGARSVIPLHPGLVEAIGEPEAAGWLFPSNGGHITAGWVSDSIRRALRAVGSNATAHQLRHSFGTAVLRSSHDLRVTQELLRHSSPASTAIYTQVADVDKVDAIRSLGWSA